jgi:hypothetical protein
MGKKQNRPISVKLVADFGYIRLAQETFGFSIIWMFGYPMNNLVANRTIWQGCTLTEIPALGMPAAV